MGYQVDPRSGAPPMLISTAPAYLSSIRVSGRKYSTVNGHIHLPAQHQQHTPAATNFGAPYHLASGARSRALWHQASQPEASNACTTWGTKHRTVRYSLDDSHRAQVSRRRCTCRHPATQAPMTQRKVTCATRPRRSSTIPCTKRPRITTICTRGTVERHSACTMGSTAPCHQTRATLFTPFPPSTLAPTWCAAEHK